MKKTGVSTLKVAAAYIGTVVGAGFATGQEIMQFFSQFGAMGLPGLILTAALFIVFGIIIMILGRELHARSHLEIIMHAGGRIIGTVIDMLITFFLFGALSAMIAGTGALFAQQFHLPALLGNILMAALTAVTVLTGINGVINAISFVVPFLLVAVTGVSIYAMTAAPPNLAAAPATPESALITNWLFAAVLYVSYNTIISVAVLGPLGAQARSSKAVKIGGILGGLGLGLGSIMIYLALSGHMTAVQFLEVPMIAIAGGISPAVQVIYAVILIAEIYTTAVGSLFGFAARVGDFRRDKPPSAKTMRVIVITATVAALAASQLGFSTLVKYLYPLVGYGGIVLLACLVYVRIKKRRSVRPL